MRHTVRSHRYLLLTMAVPQFPLAVFVADENGNPIPKATVQIWVKDQCLAQITKTAKDDKDAYRTTLPSGIPPFDLRVVTGNRLIYEKKNLRPDIGRVIFPEITVKKHVVILVHGIRDFALWQTTVGSTLEQEGFKVEATNYGRFNLLEFLAPFSYFRRKAIATVWNQIRIVKQNNEESPLSVIAHSFGTFVVAHLMQQEFDIKFNRVIFCGSVVRYGFPFEQFQDRFAQPIINEVGTRDIWPALAESVTIGYGSAGTYGFRRPLVKDRWHNGAHHGFFLDAEFCRKFWTPLLRDGTFVAGAAAPEKPRLWLQFLSVIKIKYVLVAAGLLLAICARERIATFAERLMGWSGSARIGVPDPQSIGTVQDLAVALKRIEDRKAVLNRDEIKQISADLTGTLIPSDSAIPRVTRRYMNEKIVGTIVFLNDRDLSHA